MSDFPVVQSEPMNGFATRPMLFTSTGKMAEPTGSPHVRGIEFRLPLLRDAPDVSVYITAPHGSSMMQLYAVKMNNNVSGQTQVAIEAQTIVGGPAAGDHYCSILVRGFTSAEA